MDYLVSFHIRCNFQLYALSTMCFSLFSNAILNIAATLDIILSWKASGSMQYTQII